MIDVHILTLPGIPDRITLHVGDGGLVDMCGRVVTRGEE